MPSLSQWMISPRMPADGKLMIGCVAMCVFVLAFSPYVSVGLGLLIFSHSTFTFLTSYFIATMLSFLFHAFVVWKGWGFNRVGAAEIGMAVVFFSLARLFGGDLAKLLVLVGFFAALRPMTDGPEPDGWKPMVDAWRERQRQQERDKNMPKKRDEDKK